MSRSQPERRILVFRGQVQGVGFRYTTCHVAAGYAVTGFVRNLPDGAVELVVEGTPTEIDRFIEDLKSRMSEFIRDIQPDRQAANGEFDSFEIRY